MIGSGKTSLSASLQSGLSGYAENHPAYDKDLRQTRVMEQWRIKLPEELNVNDRFKLRCSEGQYIEYEWDPDESLMNPSKVSDMVQDTNDENAMLCDEAEIFDCAGQVQYTVMTSSSLTSKSLNIVMFNVKMYQSHVSFGPLIGNYIDIILSKTMECSIIIVASHQDELKADDFLSSTQKMAEVFDKVKWQVANRMKQKESQSQNSKKTNVSKISKIKLISLSHSKLFLLSNKNNDEVASVDMAAPLTASQSRLKHAIANILLNEEMIGIKVGKENKGSMPKLWEKLHARMIDICKTTGFICSEEQAFLHFKKLKEDRMDDVRKTHNKMFEAEAAEIRIATMLERIYKTWKAEKLKRPGPMAFSLSTTLSNFSRRLRIDYKLIVKKYFEESLTNPIFIYIF